MEKKTSDPSIDNRNDLGEATNRENENGEALQTQTNSAAIPVVNQPLPKRLAALCAFFTIASISGLIANQGELFCILTIIMVIAILGRQRTAMYFLQGYTALQLALVSMLPVYLYDPDNLLVGNPSTFKIGDLQTKVPDFVIFGIIIVLAIIQVWVAFTPKVKAYFNTKDRKSVV